MNPTIIFTLLLLIVTLASSFNIHNRNNFFISATYQHGVGFNLFRPTMNIPQQPHQIQYPELYTQVVAVQQKIREAALVCDAFVPVGRTVQCEVHTFDECGNPFGEAFNTTQGWSIEVEEVTNAPGTLNRLVSPLIHIQKGVSRFYFTPLRIGLHRVRLNRQAKVYHKDFVNEELRVSDNIAGPGFLVNVHGSTMKGLSHNLGETNLALQRMLWTIASHNQEPANFPPATPRTYTFEDKEHRFDDRRYGQLQQDVRRPPIQPELFANMPDRPAKKDNNAHRLVDYARPT